MSLALGGLVLAGGQSQRMGTDKALILWQGVPLLQRVCQVAAACCQQVQVLSPWPERYQGLVPQEYLQLKERQPGNGPAIALLQGLTEMDTDWILLLACDLPCLRPEVIQSWTAQLQHVPPTVVAAVPRPDQQWQPLCGFYRHSAQTDLAHYIRAGGRSFQGWFRRLPPHPLAIGPEVLPMFRNCNSPADLDPG